MSRDLIFTVNPGATSTKCALFQITDSGVKPSQDLTIEHPDSELANFTGIPDQLEYRYQLVERFLSDGLLDDDRIVGCAGRGGMLTPVPSGAIKVNAELVEFSLMTPVYQHASNLGAPLAYKVGQQYGVDAYIVDPVCVDEFTAVARMSGSPDFNRFSFVHALNTRATARKLAQQQGRKFEDMSFVVAHLGGGFSISCIKQGRIVDNDNRMEGGAFTPERAGGVPPIPLIDACFSGEFSQQELKKKLYGEGGLYAYLGTRDLRDVEQMIETGDARAQLVYDALVYQILKSMAAMASVAHFDVDAFILTGGLAFSKRLTNDLTAALEKIGPVSLFPGSNENESLAETTVDVLQNRMQAMSWPVKAVDNGMEGW
ncbi:butyrate kinase [Amphritea balenae]|uniref:Probable butyrate kinase n=1 Tax=Amphritea balenae TaxID=452629 RepID=A0A3P1SVV0_9GAMM|nr:butyrate kinase [Amphritea balenae]RRD01301.1 butyrate kinase [Amphritea balenae]GGK58349.1 putative butyrate kinase [Amphritea balenae]